MAYKRKTKDVFYIDVNCGYGWETESRYDTYAEAKRDIKEYRLYASAYNGNAKIVKRREKANED